MSDLAATNCNTSCDRGSSWGWGNNSCLWIIILLFLCGGNSCWGNNDGCGCDSIIWILILLCCCGNGRDSGCGLSCGC